MFFLWLHYVWEATEASGSATVAMVCGEESHIENNKIPFVFVCSDASGSSL